MTANSPLLIMGKKAFKPCAIKYATAIKPLKTNAVHRVNNPSKIKIPPKNSSEPAPYVINAGAAPAELEGGKLKSFCEPCHKNKNPVIIRKTLKMRGDQLFKKSFILTFSPSFIGLILIKYC